MSNASKAIYPASTGLRNAQIVILDSNQPERQSLIEEIQGAYPKCPVIQFEYLVELLDHSFSPGEPVIFIMENKVGIVRPEDDTATLSVYDEKYPGVLGQRRPGEACSAVLRFLDQTRLEAQILLSTNADFNMCDQASFCKGNVKYLKREFSLAGILQHIHWCLDHFNAVGE